MSIEAATRISEIVAEVLTRGRASDLDEEMVGCGLLGGVLDIAKRSGRPEHWAEIFRRYAALLAAEEGTA
ncbi:hypothetical protein [Mesorhizobium sp. CN2-181]|uniref:hypothetical protein n=1 Tax=Mesorhizobium yinganensis TaxID=3157707 RepID=UPI0032B70DDC